MNTNKIIENIIKKIRGEEGEIIPFLRKIPMFESLSFRDLKKIELIVHERIFLPDEIIFHERQPGVGMYIIKRGRVKLTKLVNGEKVRIGELGEGDFFGEMALLDEYPRSAEVVATEKTEVLGIFRPDLFDLIDENPKLGTKILLKLSQILAQRLRETTEMKLKEIG